jgi:hypothetical protein
VRGDAAARAMTWRRVEGKFSDVRRGSLQKGSSNIEKIEGSWMRGLPEMIDDDYSTVFVGGGCHLPRQSYPMSAWWGEPILVAEIVPARRGACQGGGRIRTLQR